MSLEDKGIEVFEDDFLRSHAKLGFNLSQAGHVKADLKGKIKDDDLFYVDKTIGEENTSEEDEQDKLASAASMDTAKTMKVNDKGKRKRKVTRTIKKIKSVKYEPLPVPKHAVRAGTSIGKDSSADEREVENLTDSDSQDTD